jgi:glyoxylase-like metal-dependent hydrolase (beta-lactamase superfamily II)
MDDNSSLLLGSRVLRFVHTRGHAEHHFCIFDEHTQGWFSGDMFGVSYPKLRFAQGSFVMPATTPTQFDPGLYRDSVRRLAACGPRRFYLTHYSALDFDPEQADSLCRQLEAYAELGRRGPQEPRDLEARILDIATAELQRLVPPAEAKNAASQLAMDAQLNAQGIAWWRRSLAA